MGRLVKSFGRVIAADTLDAKHEGAAIRDAARSEAEALLALAQSEAAALREQAMQAGRQEGQDLARREFRGLLTSALEQAERIERAAMPSTRALAVRMAERIVGHAIQMEPHLMNEITERALMAAGARSTADGVVIVRVHPDDLPRLAAKKDSLMAHVKSGAELRLVGDPAVEPWGCIVDTRTGRLDGRLRTQLAVLERAAFGAADDPEHR